MSKPHVSSSFVISRINTGTYTCTTMNTSRSFTNEFIRHSCEIRQEGKKPVKFEKIYYRDVTGITGFYRFCYLPLNTFWWSLFSLSNVRFKLIQIPFFYVLLQPNGTLDVESVIEQVLMKSAITM